MNRRLGDIAALVEGRLVGDPDRMISGINDLMHATSGQISFLANTRYAPAARASLADAMLVPLDCTLALNCAVIHVANPSAAFAKVVEWYAPAPLSWMPGVHPTAVIHPSVVLGRDVFVGPHVVVEAGSVLGDRVHCGAGVYIGHECKIGPETFLYPRVTLRERTLLGARVRIHSGVVIGSDGFGYEFQGGQHVKVPQVGYVQIDDDVEIGANTTIDRGRFDKTWIQQGVKIDNLVMIAHNVVVGAHSIIVAQCGLSGSSSLGSHVTMAGQSALVGHVKVGDKITITGWTAVTKNLTGPGIYRGAPAKPIKEAMEIEALTMRLPEVYERLRALEKKAEGDSKTV